MSYKERMENLIKSKTVDFEDGFAGRDDIKSIIEKVEEQFSRVDWEQFSNSGFDKKNDYCFIYSYPPVRTLSPIVEEHLSPINKSFELNKNANLYIHIPYCTGICNYCYFAKVLDNKNAQIIRSDYPRYLEKEYKHFKEILGYTPKISSVHFGGGTPSLLSQSDLEQIFGFLSEDLLPDIEITMECAPETIIESPEKLQFYHSIGINRLNLGVESLDNNVLRLMGRRHGAEDTIKALDLMLANGFNNINVDVIFNLPGQSLSSWIDTLIQLESKGVHSISAYRLRKHPKKHITSMPEQVFPEYIEGLKMQLAHGIFMAENNWVRSSSHKYARTVEKLQVQIESKRGINNNELIGIGCGAYGFVNDTFYWNTKSLTDYKLELEANRLPLWIGERLTEEEKMNKVMVLGMHTNKGVSVAEFFAEFGVSPLDKYKSTLDKLRALKILEETEEFIRPNEMGRFFCDEISVSFYSEKKKLMLDNLGMKYGMFFEDDKYV